METLIEPQINYLNKILRSYQKQVRDNSIEGTQKVSLFLKEKNYKQRIKNERSRTSNRRVKTCKSLLYTLET